MLQNELLIQIQKAHKLREAQKIEEAFTIAKNCFRLAPREPEVILLLGSLYLEKREYFLAEKYLTTAIALKPEKAEYKLFLGKLLQILGKNSQAEKVLENCIASEPKLYLAYFYLGKALVAENKLYEALHAFKRGSEVKPDFSKFHFNVAILYHKLGLRQEAIEAYQHCLKLDPNNVALLSNYGALLTQDRQYEKAIRYYEKALAIEPNHLGAMSNLAGTYIEQNEFAKAEKYLRKCLEIEPNMPSMWRNLTLCVNYDTLTHPDVLKIQSLFEKETVKTSLIHYNFALGKIHLDCQKDDEAFDFFAKGNALREAEVSFNPEAFRNHIDLIIRLFHGSLFEKFTFAKKNLPDPIFIIGTSRSGKSLLEEILARHPAIYSAGEVGFAENIAKIPKSERPKGNYPFWVQDLTSEQAIAMRRAFLRRLLQGATPLHKYVIDTLPGNFMYLGILAMLFPNAKFIHCTRNPLDACLLMHFKYFAQGHSYTNNLAKLGIYYRQYERLMFHWEAVLPKQIYEVNYEELITSPEKVLAGLTRYLALDNIPLAQNLHRKEIGIHARFGKFLGPLHHALAEPFLQHKTISFHNLYLADLLGTAKHHYAKGDYVEAKRLISDYLLEVPDNPEALYLIAMLNLKMHQFQKAITYFEKTLNLAPSAQVYEDLALAYEGLHKRVLADKARFNAQMILKSIPEKETRLTPEAEAILESAFLRNLDKIMVKNNKLLFKARGEPTEPDSYLARSWDRYFTDLSYGSFRNLTLQAKNIWRMRAWHFLYKNIAAVNDIYQSKKECRILDLGCSTGYFRRFLEGNFNPEDKKTLYYWGVDIRETALQNAINAADDIESGASGNYIPSAFVVHDFKDPLPFKDSFFDYVISFEAIKYLPVGQGRTLLKEIYRVCKPTAKFFLSTSYSVDKPGFMETVPFEEVERMIEESGFTFLQKKGSQATLQGLSKFLKKEHLPLINDLLKVYPPEMVAAMITPLYPQCSSQVTFWCGKRIEKDKSSFKLRDS